MTDVYNTGKGFAFVTFDREEDSQTAMREMDGNSMFGKQIKAGGGVDPECVLLDPDGVPDPTRSRWVPFLTPGSRIRDG